MCTIIPQSMDSFRASLGTSSMSLLCVVTLAKGTTIGCEPRLDQGHA
ncbi:MAG: hypothetical protein KZQ65_06160 [Candidatus Thiodiazotropha sp. (ex Gloverina cf. vestifex)]|nr:hypothetical protein [Candidatus Thiodiazotropha sp. (ex Gloverina cf. vestifex)]